jgi:hypothetical protein
VCVCKKERGREREEEKEGKSGECSVNGEEEKEEEKKKTEVGEKRKRRIKSRSMVRAEREKKRLGFVAAIQYTIANSWMVDHSCATIAMDRVLPPTVCEGVCACVWTERVCDQASSDAQVGGLLPSSGVCSAVTQITRCLSCPFCFLTRSTSHRWLITSSPSPFLTMSKPVVAALRLKSTGQTLELCRDSTLLVGRGSFAGITSPHVSRKQGKQEITLFVC